MSLVRYQKKRDFARTPEPRGKAAPGHRGALHFVIQKHAASRLHYDFRLELDGVLKSWAVPKGPSLDPARKVLAVQVEDHPLSYEGFEGVIPAGQYGGGTVMVWDRGTWEALDDPHEGMAGGRLRFVLHGEKLKGEWSLVRMAGRAGGNGKNWLLMKARDRYSGEREIVEEAPESVKTGRSLEEIAGRELPSGTKAGAAKEKQASVKKVATKPAETKTRARAKAATSQVQEAREMNVAGVTLTHPDKILYPDDGVTKRDLAAYYQRVQELLLPYAVDRPLALVRCPAGLSSKCFFMRNWSATLPPAIDKIDVGTNATTGRREIHVLIHDAAGLASLVQISALEIHTWNCVAHDLEHPDQLVFDLDPGPGLEWRELVVAAGVMRKMLSEMGMPVFVKTSGGKGLHLVVPIAPNASWEQAAGLCRAIAEYQAAQAEVFIAEMRKDLRPGKIYIDYLRNGRGASAIAPYSTRARAGAAVSMPVAWEELGKLTAADQFKVGMVAAYLEKRKTDPWAAFASSRVDIRKMEIGRKGRGGRVAR